MRDWELVLERIQMSELDHLECWEWVLWVQGIPPGPKIEDTISLVCMMEEAKQYNYETDPSNTPRAMGSIQAPDPPIQEDLHT